MSGTLMLERIAPGPAREAYLSLLHLADEPEPVRGYLQAPEGELYVLRHAGDEPLRVTFVLPHAGEEGTVELRAVAVDQTRHNQGRGRETLTRVLADLTSRGARRVIVGTSNAGIGQIAFYQKAGFRHWRIERDYFTLWSGSTRSSRQTTRALRLPMRDDADKLEYGVYRSHVTGRRPGNETRGASAHGRRDTRAGNRGGAGDPAGALA